MQRAPFQVGRSAIALALAVGAAAVTPGHAQGVARSVRVTAENDYFDFWRRPDERPDDNYTQGASVAVDLAAPPLVNRRLLCGTRALCASSLEVGQARYTPTEDFVQPLPGERPYAGWLYARDY